MLKKKLFNTIAIFILIFILTGCYNKSADSGVSYEPDTSTALEETFNKAKNIFYQMYLPHEMYKVFEKAGAEYNPNILNPVEKVNQYASSYKAALNLGVYGVDLSYNRMFNQSQKTLLYFSVIHKLSQQLGIPDSQFAYVIRKMEKNITNKDSISYYAAEIYKTTNRYLTENERQSTAALIIMGGWVEAIYVASQIANDNINNQEIIERIAFQKYSLRNLISILSNYQSEPIVHKYLLLLQDLNRTFDKFEIYYKEGDLSIDTINKFISANDVKMDVSAEAVKEIKDKITKIRSDIVN
jgi:hypothetical protein